MKHTIILSFLIGCFFCAAAQSKDETLIRNAMDEQMTAWNAGNLERYMDTYWHDDSLMFIGSRGPTYGWDNTLKNYKRGYPDTASMGKLDFNIISIKKLSETYYSVVGKWHLKRTAGDLSGAFTLLFRKIKGKWLIIQDHSS